MRVLLVNLMQKEDMMVVVKISHHTLTDTQHTYNQTGGDLDCLSAITPEGLLPHSLVFSQTPNGTYNATTKETLRD